MATRFYIAFWLLVEVEGGSVSALAMLVEVEEPVAHRSDMHLTRYRQEIDGGVLNLLDRLLVTTNDLLHAVDQRSAPIAVDLFIVEKRYVIAQELSRWFVLIYGFENGLFPLQIHVVQDISVELLLGSFLRLLCSVFSFILLVLLASIGVICLPRLLICRYRSVGMPLMGKAGGMREAGSRQGAGGSGCDALLLVRLQPMMHLLTEVGRWLIPSSLHRSLRLLKPQCMP
mmetsp:Transcript_23267/g.75664  ORF Transcript_23267/g.75664 Transcript_23267/m.75664 type:complete len:229 (-) Transcript_23267:401-1087(-)